MPADVPQQARLALDTGAVIAYSRGDSRAREHILSASRQGLLVVMPSIVALEALRPRPDDPSIRRVIHAVNEILPLTGRIAERAARLLGLSGVGDLADAVVVAEALEVHGSHILTGDPDDIFALLEAAPRRGFSRVHRV